MVWGMVWQGGRATIYSTVPDSVVWYGVWGTAGQSPYICRAAVGEVGKHLLKGISDRWCLLSPLCSALLSVPHFIRALRHSHTTVHTISSCECAGRGVWRQTHRTIARHTQKYVCSEFVRVDGVCMSVQRVTWCPRNTLAHARSMAGFTAAPSSPPPAISPAVL